MYLRFLLGCGRMSSDIVQVRCCVSCYQYWWQYSDLCIVAALIRVRMQSRGHDTQDILGLREEVQQ